MKYLVLMLLITACGKHEQPVAKDLRDSDGDQIVNDKEQSEIDKYIADVTPFANVQAEMKIKQGLAALQSYSFMLGNDSNISAYSKDLMVKHPKTLPVDEYFSEFSLLRIKSEKASVTITEEETPVQIVFKNLKGQPKVLSLIAHGKKIYLGTWTDTIDVKLKREHLLAILEGEAFLALSRNTRNQMNTDQSQEDAIKEKTYRVFVNDGQEAKVYYVSKELSFNDFLMNMKITSYKMIEDVNLLSKGIKSDVPAWWVKNMNGSDKVVVKTDLRSLSEHYFMGFNKLVINAQRINGAATSSAILKKEYESKALLKIRPFKTHISFDETEMTEKYGQGGGRDNSDRFTCRNNYRLPRSENQTSASFNFLHENIQIHAEGALIYNFHMEQLEDEMGPFFEIEIPSGISQVNISLKDVAKSEYFQVGMYKSHCHNGVANRPIVPDLRTSEGKLDLQIEAFVENL